jgi:transposase
VLAAVRGLNRLERVGETLRAALNEVAVMAPAWLQALAPAQWYERYASRVENYRLPKRRVRIWRPPSGPTGVR